MRALVLENPGTPPTLSVAELPDPVPAPREAVVRVAACGFCHHDRLVMGGTLRRGIPSRPVLGHEIAGVVHQVGNGVTAVRPGDRVVSLLTSACGHCDRCSTGREHRCRNGEGIGHGRNGGFAEFVSVSEHSLLLLPPEVSLETACLLACPAGVALQALLAVGLSAGETVVVIGAGGGLGVHAVQLAAAMGARTIAVTSSPHKAGALSRLGANEVIEAGELDFSEIVLALNGDEGADAVIDTVGTATLGSSVRSLAQYGRLALLGEVGGAGNLRGIIPEIVFRDARVQGVSGVSRATLEQAVRFAADGRLRPVLQEVMPLEEAVRAFDLVSQRAVIGRVALDPRLSPHGRSL